MDTDLFIYLQPSATGLIYESRDYEKKYMESIRQLGLLNQTEPDARLGKKLLFLIRDFVGTLTDWKKETADKYSYTELYGKTWAECRNFVLPMNPVRKELEFAVKSSLAEYGVKVHQTAPKQPKPVKQPQQPKQGQQKTGKTQGKKKTLKQKNK